MIFLALQDIFPGGTVVPGRKVKKKGMNKGVEVSIEGGAHEYDGGVGAALT